MRARIRTTINLRARASFGERRALRTQPQKSDNRNSPIIIILYYIILYYIIISVPAQVVRPKKKKIVFTNPYFRFAHFRVTCDSPLVDPPPPPPPHLHPHPHPSRSYHVCTRVRVRTFMCH